MSVVDLKGQPVSHDLGVTDPAMVEFIEDLLRRAKGGKVIGLVGGFMMENGTEAKFTSTFVFCDTNMHNAMLGVVEIAKVRLATKILED